MNSINQSPAPSPRFKRPPVPGPQPLTYIAIDLGTTAISGAVIDASGKVLATASRGNPQRAFGADILERLGAARNGAGKQLQELMVDELRCLVAELLDKSKRLPADVAGIAAAGNPGMTCLLCNAPVDGLLLPPHKPPFDSLLSISPAEIDIGLPGDLDLLPPVSGFVGGDLVACLLAMDDRAPGTLLIDLGTNAELALWDGQRWLVTSVAAGPAFEAGNIGSGMLHAAGAVTDVHLAGDRLTLIVAGGGRPRGLCGSGLAALVAAARQGKLIDASGRILQADEVETNLNRYLVARGGAMAICFYRDPTGELLLTQADLRSMQLAKAAVYAGACVLLEKTGMQATAVEQVFLTGALGVALRPDVLKKVALLPEPMLDKTTFLANGVLAGLQAYLTDQDRRQRLKRLLENMQPFPLSGTPAFEKHFLAGMGF